MGPTCPEIPLKTLRQREVDRQVKSRTAGLVVAGALCLAACTGGPAASSPAAAGSPAAPSYGPAFKVSGNAKTGSSTAIALEGSYLVEWSATPDKPGCTFHLFIADSADGPATIDLGQSTIPGKAAAVGSATVSVSSGRYFLRPDRSAATDCKGTWSAMISPQVAGPS
jgi:hypothetical protein